MPPIIYSFGDVFRYKEKDYIFLAQTEDTIFAAEILGKEDSRQRQRLIMSVVKNSARTYQLNQNVLLCIVELPNTEEYKDRVAFFGHTDKGELADFFTEFVCRLADTDLANLHKEIMEDELAVSELLKDKVKDIKIVKAETK